MKTEKEALHDYISFSKKNEKLIIFVKGKESFTKNYIIESLKEWFISENFDKEIYHMIGGIAYKMSWGNILENKIKQINNSICDINEIDNIKRISSLLIIFTQNANSYIYSVGNISCYKKVNEKIIQINQINNSYIGIRNIEINKIILDNSEYNDLLLTNKYINPNITNKTIYIENML